MKTNPLPSSITISVAEAKVFVQPRVLATPLTTLKLGVVAPVLKSDGEWFLVQFDDQRWGTRAGYVHCSEVGPLSIETPETASAASATPVTGPTVASAPDPPLSPSGAPVTPPPAKPATTVAARPPTPEPQPTPPERPVSPGPVSSSATSRPGTPASPPRAAPTARQERVHGYAEWKRDGFLIVDGQRVTGGTSTRLDLKGVSRPLDIPLGYEVTATGWRQPDGSILARELEAKPNGLALFEADVIRDAERAEQVFRQQGTMFGPQPSGQFGALGRVRDAGTDVDRVRAIAGRLAPPYVDRARLHLYVVDTDVWNAKVLPNGSIWVMAGLLNDVSDDELAVVLGHELAHYTHEHSRRAQKNSLWAALAGLAASVALQEMSNQTAADALGLARNLALAAWVNGYSREQEDQADRVGLRYAYEAGFDVTRGPALWRRVQEQYGQLPKFLNLISGQHSRPSERAQNLEREVQLNYTLRN